MLLSLNPNTPSYVRNISNSNIHPRIKKYCVTVRFRNTQVKTVKASMKPYIVYMQTYSTHIYTDLQNQFGIFLTIYYSYEKLRHQT